MRYCEHTGIASTVAIPEIKPLAQREGFVDLPHYLRRNRGPYRAVMSSWPHTQGPGATFRTIRACGQWAENFGTSWDRCVVTDREYRKVAEFRRDLRCVASRWFRV
jgi:hypothetical protein